MEKIKEELKLMQSNPKLYLANYFQDLKRDVDLTFFRKEDEKSKYLEIINKIEEIEQGYYLKSKPFNTFDQVIEIESLDEQSIDDLKYKIEMELFQNKSILFIKKSFLLLINDAYLRQSILDNYSKYFID